jgi:hypothetical protein
MSGHHEFSELTKRFTPEDRGIVEVLKTEMREVVARGSKIVLPHASDMALKEWAVAVKSLGRGEQALILRKGGIHRDDRDFRMVHPEFLLFPTYLHQKSELIKPEHRETLRETVDEDDTPGVVELAYFCQVVDRFELRDESALDTISSHHIWTDDYAHKRLHWRPKQPLTVALLRVFVLHQPQALPVLDEYSGCKSWVELGQEVPLGTMSPVMDDAEFERQCDAVRSALGATPAAV